MEGFWDGVVQAEKGGVFRKVAPVKVPVPAPAPMRREPTAGQEPEATKTCKQVTASREMTS